MRQTQQSADGTSFHGSTVRATVQDLKTILGQPEFSDNDGRDKVNFEWTMETEAGDVFTVYSWKEYRPLAEDETIVWHIGGHSKRVTVEAKAEIERILVFI
jgi:hypothetical protein